MAEWHPRLQNWEAQRPDRVSPQEHEKAWEHEPEIRQKIEDLRHELAIYAEALATISKAKR
jgi:hypothetical protein